jgi:hypothetical protein
MDLGPGPLTITPDSPFFLSTDDWVALQNYTAIGASIPCQDMFASPLQTSFPQFCTIAANAYGHCVNWSSVAAPVVLQIARDIAAWAANVPERYANLQSAATGAADSPNASAQLTAAIQGLASDASQYQGDAQRASQSVANFIQECQQDQSDINQFLASADFAQFASYCSSASSPLPEQIWMSLRNMAMELSWTDGPMQGLGAAEGVWEAIQDTLSNIEQQAAAPNGSAFVAGLQLQTAIEQWQQVGEAAQGFLSNSQAASA